jgi:hypothetical protein
MPGFEDGNARNGGRNPQCLRQVFMMKRGYHMPLLSNR